MDIISLSRQRGKARATRIDRKRGEKNHFIEKIFKILLYIYVQNGL